MKHRTRDTNYFSVRKFMAFMLNDVTFVLLTGLWRVKQLCEYQFMREFMLGTKFI